jgi:hypothetical protein
VAAAAAAPTAADQGPADQVTQAVLTSAAEPTHAEPSFASSCAVLGSGCEQCTMLRVIKGRHLLADSSKGLPEATAGPHAPDAASNVTPAAGEAAEASLPSIDAFELDVSEAAAAYDGAPVNATIQAQGRPGFSFGGVVRRSASVPPLGSGSSKTISSSGSGVGGNLGIHRRARGDQDSPNNVPFPGTNTHNTPGAQEGSSEPGVQPPNRPGVGEVPESSSRPDTGRRPGVVAPGQQSGGSWQDSSAPGRSPNGAGGWGSNSGSSGGSNDGSNGGNSWGGNGGNRGGSEGPHEGEHYYGGHQPDGNHWYGNPDYNNHYGGGQYGGGEQHYGGDGHYGGQNPGGPGSTPEQWTCTACNQERNYMLRMMPDGTMRCGKTASCTAGWYQSQAQMTVTVTCLQQGLCSYVTLAPLQMHDTAGD